jgi:hypothetical protein
VTVTLHDCVIVIPPQLMLVTVNAVEPVRLSLSR